MLRSAGAGAAHVVVGDAAESGCEGEHEPSADDEVGGLDPSAGSKAELADVVAELAVARAAGAVDQEGSDEKRRTDNPACEQRARPRPRLAPVGRVHADESQQRDLSNDLRVASQNRKVPGRTMAMSNQTEFFEVGTMDRSKRT